MYWNYEKGCFCCHKLKDKIHVHYWIFWELPHNFTKRRKWLLLSVCGVWVNIADSYKCPRRSSNDYKTRKRENIIYLLFFFRRKRTLIKHIRMKMIRTRSFASMLEAKGINHFKNYWLYFKNYTYKYFILKILLYAEKFWQISWHKTRGAGKTIFLRTHSFLWLHNTISVMKLLFMSL